MKSQLLALIVAATFSLAANAAPVSGKSPAQSATAPATKAAPDPYSFAPLAGVPEEFSFSGTQQDLLGVVQSFARGMAQPGAKPVSPSMGGAAQLLSDADLLAVVQHIHVVRAKSFSFDKLDDAARAQVADVQAFYATQFTKAGGRRQMAFNKSDTTLALWVFDSPKSWALVTRGPSRAIVVRADGFPDLAVFGRLFRVALSSN